ncbi:MAG: hypothetical protein R3D25_11105 [Geminicoccaceae bacterium]
MLAVLAGAVLVGWAAHPLVPELQKHLRWPAEPRLVLLGGAVPLLLAFLVDRLEKARFRARPPLALSAEHIVHRTSPLASALLPIAWGIFATAVASVMLPAFLPWLGLPVALVMGLAVALIVRRERPADLRLEFGPDGLRLEGRGTTLIPWPAIGAARLVWRQSRSSTHFYLALALDHPERYGLGRMSWLGRLVTSGEEPGDVLLTPLDRFLARPTRIVEDVQLFVARQREPRAAAPQ